MLYYILIDSGCPACPDCTSSPFVFASYFIVQFYNLFCYRVLYRFFIMLIAPFWNS